MPYLGELGGSNWSLDQSNSPDQSGSLDQLEPPSSPKYGKKFENQLCENLGDDNFLYTKKGFTADASSSTFRQGLKFSSIGETGATLTSLGTGTTFGVVVFKKLSSAGLY